MEISLPVHRNAHILRGDDGTQSVRPQEDTQIFYQGRGQDPSRVFFKVVPYLVAAWIAILYAPVSDEMKHSFFNVSSLILVGLCILVGIIAWFRPKNLVYGESGHRAERKLEFGTEERVINETDLDLLEKGQNPRQLKGGTQ